jgi:ribonuclease P protein component
VSSLRKSEILRGYRSFSPVFRNGVRQEGRLVRALLTAVPSPHPRVLVGISVPARTFDAVRRSRLKRLLRAAFVAEREPLVLAAREREVEIRVVLVFRGADTIDVRRLGTTDLRRELARLVSTASRLRGLRP